MEETIDPTVKLTKFLKEDKLEEAFHMALSAGDVDVVSWLCNQVTLFLGNTWLEYCCEFGYYEVTAFEFDQIVLHGESRSSKLAELQTDYEIVARWRRYSYLDKMVVLDGIIPQWCPQLC